MAHHDVFEARAESLLAEELPSEPPPPPPPVVEPKIYQDGAQQTPVLRQHISSVEHKSWKDFPLNQRTASFFARAHGQLRTSTGARHSGLGGGNMHMTQEIFDHRYNFPRYERSSSQPQRRQAALQEESAVSQPYRQTWIVDHLLKARAQNNENVTSWSGVRGHLSDLKTRLKVKALELTLADSPADFYDGWKGAPSDMPPLLMANGAYFRAPSVASQAFIADRRKKIGPVELGQGRPDRSLKTMRAIASSPALSR
mmetsp:Transcript_41733/g.109925  ORF Transcript_41733/g.109925 Transcript_41733/m.109925 type:complete len:256 (-) Transcript_41733:41-808(-)